MTNQRALDGEEDTASGDAVTSIEAEEQRDVVGIGDIDPLRGDARSSRPKIAPTARASDGLACYDCLEPLRTGEPTRVVLVGEIEPMAIHVDCGDPAGRETFDCGRRLY